MRTIGASLFALALFTSSFALAQQLELPRLSPNAKMTQTVGLTEISVEYSSPGVRGRPVWGTVVPYGEVWRAGANSATKVTFSKDVTFGGTALPAGSYALFVIPAAFFYVLIMFVREAALIRLRPVLMTSAATICGHFPLTLVSGAGAAARNSIGITIVAGMALGTIFTLLVIPSIYVLIAKQHVGEESGTIARDFALAEEKTEAVPQASGAPVK